MAKLTRNEASALAHRHVENTLKRNFNEIKNSVLHTKIYGGPGKKPTGSSSRNGTAKVEFLNTDSVTAAIERHKGKTAVLNFASYKGPGGGFITGAMAQEEMLCHESALYSVLKAFEQTYYSWNREHLNKALYTDRALYSEDVMFYRDSKDYKFDVITCAAPNYGPGRRYGNVTPVENKITLQSRIEFVLKIAEEQKVDTLIAGAFGCGVFKQQPVVVAEIFLDCIRRGVYKGDIIFAVPFDNLNAKVFEGMVNKYNK